jgi:para-nitrobenzyl esterase
MKKPILFLPLLLLPLMYFATSRHEDNAISIEKLVTGSGAISGIQGLDPSVKIFKGIPFAEPPVGDLRWKAPLPVKPWDGIKKCDRFSASAMQAKPAPFAMWSKEFMAPEEPLSEDCLYLNVWTAAKRQDEKRPVIVWIHGGAFTGGSGSVPLYDGEEMAKKGVVFITINYRLGIFGFLASTALSDESPDKVSGNYGILDQVEALRWVRKNAAAFGGDPDRVTIAGQSAGAMSVNELVVSPKARGLFQRAIAQSGGMFTPDTASYLKDAEKQGDELMKRINVSSLSDLRSLSAEALMKAGGRMGPVVDNVVILPPYQAFREHKQNDVPVLTGWNADDLSFFAPKQSAGNFTEQVRKNFGQDADRFLKLFPAENDEQALNSQKIISVLSFGGQNYRWAMTQTSFSQNPAWLYYFTRVPPGEPNFGAFHSAEFGYALATLKMWNRPFTDVDFRLSEIMSSYWVNFAATGNPNGKGLPEWPAFDQKTKQAIEFGDQVKTIEVPYRAQLEFFEYQEFGNKGLAK